MVAKLIAWGLFTSLVLAGPAAAQLMVMSATGPSAHAFPEGSTLPANGAFTLAAGDTLVVMDATGSRVITGPRVVTTARMGQDTQVKLASLFKRWRPTKINGIAAVRGVKTSGSEPIGLWQIDVARGGTYCVMSGRPLAFWRDPAQMVAQLVVSRSGGEDMHTLVWPANAAQLPWPNAVTFADGNRFAVMRDDQPAVVLTLRRIDPAPSDLGSLISALVDRHCDDQLARLQTKLELGTLAQASP